MIIQAHTKIRSARTTHLQELLHLLRTSERTHHHLDWQNTVSWLQQHPCHVAFAKNNPIGILSIPTEKATVAWLRLATVQDNEPDTSTMTPLWINAREQLRQQDVTRAVALTTNIWPERLIPPWGFVPCGHVVVLRRDQIAPPPFAKTETLIRTATHTNLEEIFQVDQAAFGPLWRYSLRMLKLALKQAKYSIVAYNGSDIIGYLLASKTNGKVFLARLAVTPKFQHSGVGRTLVLEMLHHFSCGCAPIVEVNTQEDNVASISLYQALDFELTGDKAQVWHCEIN